jgi:hypothetical protein
MTAKSWEGPTANLTAEAVFKSRHANMAFFGVDPKKVPLFLRPKKAKKVYRFCTAPKKRADRIGGSWLSFGGNSRV